MWSLATENGKGITAVPSNELTPLTIDPNYVAGFVWTRQYGFRVVKSFKNVAFGVSAENPQLLYTATLAGTSPTLSSAAPRQRRQLQRGRQHLLAFHLHRQLHQPETD